MTDLMIKPMTDPKTDPKTDHKIVPMTDQNCNFWYFIHLLADPPWCCCGLPISSCWHKQGSWAESSRCLGKRGLCKIRRNCTGYRHPLGGSKHPEVHWAKGENPSESFQVDTPCWYLPSSSTQHRISWKKLLLLEQRISCPPTTMFWERAVKPQGLSPLTSR